MSKTLQRAIMVLILVAALVAAYLILTYEPGTGGEAQTSEGGAPGEGVNLVTWNLYNFGRSKDASEVAFMADVLRPFDLVAIQEVSTGPAGAQAVARLVDELSRTGARWDFRVSEPTSGRGAERYAYLWKPSRVKLAGRPWLEPSLADPIDREPFMARFEAGGRPMLLASFHAVPTAKKPATEIVLLDALDRRYPDDNLLVMGDFNLSQEHSAFDVLRTAGLQPVLVDQRTSIRMKVGQDGRHLANEYDNIFYEAGPLEAERAGVIDFTGEFATLKEARTISDHLPVYMQIGWNGMD